MTALAIPATVLPCSCYNVRIEHPADVTADELSLGADGSSFRVSFPDGSSHRFTTRLVARFNVSNCLAALTTGFLHHIPTDVMDQALAGFEAVPGRMERIEVGQPFTTVVDYAHTAESLELVLRVLRPLTAGRLIVVFGSAGERDRVKRPHMGRVAAHLADFAVITDEDPAKKMRHRSCAKLPRVLVRSVLRKAGNLSALSADAKALRRHSVWRGPVIPFCWQARDTSKV